MVGGFLAEFRMSNAPGSLPPSAPFTDIRDVAVSLPRDPSAVWANADKMTQCKYEVRAGRLGKQVGCAGARHPIMTISWISQPASDLWQ